MNEDRVWPNAQVYRSGLYTMSHGCPFHFYSLTQPDKQFSNERGFFNLIQGRPECGEPGQSNRFGYPKDFIGPLPTLRILKNTKV